ncbi:MAG: rod shape-determining protein RodA [Verrucomicrobiota bacterium]|nr:rod shape-determining protein RodA [Verrucomicrobiota bacterium]
MKTSGKNNMDWILHLTILFLLITSVVFVYSAQFQSINETGSIWLKQLIYAGIGIIFYFVTALFNYRKLIRWSGWIYSLAIFLLILVFLFPEVNGAHRWISVKGLTIQPSEFSKLAVIIMLSAFASAPDRDPDAKKTFFTSLLIIIFPLVLIIIEPDLSSALILLPATLTILLYAGIQRKLLTITSGLLLVFTVLICLWIKYETPNQKSISTSQTIFLPEFPLMESYQKERIKVFLSDEYASSDSGWNKLQAQVAVGSGGLRGKGYLEGTQNMLGFLPRTVAPTDFIFCVIAEETGFIGSLIILFLYTILIARCLRTSWRAIDEFGRMMALGLSVLFFSHIFVNIAMTIGLLPITGLPLPLMSYGGSFIISTLLGLGLIQSIYQRRELR